MPLKMPEKVRQALANAFAVGRATGLGDFIDEVEGHQRFDQADSGKNQGVRADNSQGFKGE